MSTNQQQAILDHWNSYFTTLGKAGVNITILFPMTGTGIFNAWEALYLKGKQLGPATSYEYPSVDWQGNAIICQDFGSYRIEYYAGSGLWFCYGPTGRVS